MTATALTYRTARGDSGRVVLPRGAWVGSWTVNEPRVGLAVVTRKPTVRLMDVRTGRLRRPVDSSIESRTPVWSPDGKRLAVQTRARDRWNVTVADLESGNRRTYPVPAEPMNVLMQWSPDQTKLAYRSPR